jgi:membrane protein DedA with SNARE-associated domain
MHALAAALPAFLTRDPLPFEFAFLLLFGFCLPISEEIALALVGAAIRAALAPFWAAALVALAALLAQDNAYFSLARLLGPRLLESRLLSRLIGARAAESGRRYLERRGPTVVFASRFVVGLRSAVILGSGLFGLEWRRFLVFDALAASISTPAWLYLGYALGSQLEAKAEAGVARILGLVGPAAILLVAVLVFLSVRADRAKAEAEERAQALAKAVEAA